MPILNPFVSTSRTTPATNDVRASGDVYSQVSRQEEQNAGNMGQAINQFAGSLEHVLKQNEKVDSMYVAQTHADMSTNMFETMQKAKSTAQPGDDMGGAVLGQFDQRAANYIKNAPNDKTREHMLTSFVGYRQNLWEHMKKGQIALDEQALVQDYNQTAQRLGAIVSQEPQQAAGVIATLEAKQKALAQAGVPAQTLSSLADQSSRAIATIGATSQASKNPTETLLALKQGQFNELGAHTVDHISKVATSTLVGTARDLSSRIESINKQLAEAQTIDNGQLNKLLAETQEFVTKNPSAGHVDDLVQRATNAVNLKNISTSMENMSIPQMLRARDLKTEELRSNPQVPANELKQTEAFFNSRIKVAREDPMAYASQVGIIPQKGLQPSIWSSDGTINPQMSANMAELGRMAMKAQAGLVTVNPVSPLDDAGIEQLSATMNRLEPVQQMEQIKALQNFGPEGVKGIMAKLQIKNPAMAQAVDIAPHNQALALEIVQGRKLYTENKGAIEKVDPTVERTAAQTLARIFPNDPSMVTKYLDAALAVYANRQLYPSPGGKNTLSEVVDQVAGVVTTESNWFSANKVTILPDAGWSKEQFTKAIDRVPDFIHSATNGIPQFVDGEHIDFSQIPPSQFEYRPLGGGKYIMLHNGLPVQNELHEPLKIDFNQIPKN